MGGELQPLDSFDKNLKLIGEFGRFQQVQFVFFALNALYDSWHLLSAAILGASPVFFCQHYPEVDPCSLEFRCLDYVYDKNFTSIVSEWDLVCGDAYKAALTQSLFMAGVLAGSTFYGFLSDSWGRKKSFFLSLILLILYASASGVAPDYKSYLIFRFFAGMQVGGMVLVRFVLVSETIVPSKRALIITLTAVAFSIGIMIYSILAYFIRSWRMLIAVTTLPGALFLLFTWYIPESPRWLVSQGRIQEAEEVLFYMATRNGTQVSRKSISIEKNLDVRPKTGGDRPGLAECMRAAEFRKRIILLMFIWFTCGMVYYGLTLSTSNLSSGGNMYVNLFLSGLVEIPAILITLPFLDNHGRCFSLCGSLLIGTLGCLTLLTLPPHSTALKVLMAMTGKMGITAAFNVVYIYTTELLPTIIRNTGLGICSMSGRMGGITAPLVSYRGERTIYLSFGCAGLIASLCSLFLPETLHKPLPATIQDLIHLSWSQTSLSY